MKVGVYNDVPEHVYRSWPAPSYSLLKHVAKSPAHALAYMQSPPEQTPAQRLGYLTHIACLEPDRFRRLVVPMPADMPDRRTREGKARWAAFVAEHPDAEVVPADDYESMLGMANAVMDHPAASALVSAEGRRLELSLFWEEDLDKPDATIPVKGRIDLLSRVGGITTIADLKTTRDASPRGFAREVANYSYMEQGAWYRRGLNAIAPAQREVAWIAVENTPPYAVGVYSAFASDLEAAEARILGWLETWEWCRWNEHFPAYSNEIEPLVMPAWAYKLYEVSA
jgi:dsDNA-binding SOS-regulon protein